MATNIQNDPTTDHANSRGMDVRTVTLRTLTPIWTGNANRAMDRIHETSILGSLRWWYEALVRGAGGWACDPTAEARCSFDIQSYKQARQHIPAHINVEGQERYLLRKAGLCDVCQIFGATSWRRRVQLQIEGQRFSRPIPGNDQSAQVRITRERPDPNNPEKMLAKQLVWLVPNGASGDVTLTLWGDGSTIGELVQLLQVVVPRAAIGPRTQTGYGVVEFADSSDTALKELDSLRSLDSIRRLGELGNPGMPNPLSDTSNLPSSDRMFFARLQIDSRRDNSDIKEMLHTKVDLRNQFRGAAETARRHRIMGTVHDGRQGAKINVSRSYGPEGAWLMRIWGWAPQNDIDIVRKRVASYLQQRDGVTVVWAERLPGVPHDQRGGQDDV